MKAIQSNVLVALFAAAALMFGAIDARAQDPQAPPSGLEQAMEAQSAQGRLVAVDPDARTLTIETVDGARMDFSYTEETEVSGADADVAGLAPMAGSNVTVHYEVDSATQANTATRIEVQPQQ